ncbi:MAG TPA: redox-regulated ATPase YchF [Syntrophales bacterium]|nr:redox-regulated ATPase YchF [Syntrophales bacterium]
MKIGIIGLPQTGKRTLFGLLTGARIDGPFDSAKMPEGVAEILDPRFDRLNALYRPKKETRARLSVQLLPDLDSESIREGKIFRDIAGLDALCHVVRAFRDDSVYHVSGAVDPARDIEFVNAELLLHDLLFIEKRFERMEKDAKRTRAEALKKEAEVLQKFKRHLEADRPLRALAVSAEEGKVVSGYPFITMKSMIVALNVSEGDLTDSGLSGTLAARFQGQGMTIMRISAKLEAEIATLSSAEEREAFLKDAGIEEPALHLLSRLCMDAVGLISFFTVGEDEVRQWLIPKGASAPEAGGAIHSDIQRGFIRAEVIQYGDLMEYGSEEAVKKAGKLSAMGKDYRVADGDIINFRFNV